MIRNTARDVWRSSWWRHREPLAQSELLAAGEADDGTLDLEAVAHAVKLLPQRQAQVLLLVFGHGMTVSESAEVLGISRGSAATRCGGICS